MAIVRIRWTQEGTPKPVSRTRISGDTEPVGAVIPDDDDEGSREDVWSARASTWMNMVVMSTIVKDGGNLLGEERGN
jgi:hypothetical protein